MIEPGIAVGVIDRNAASESMQGSESHCSILLFEIDPD